MRSSEQLFLSSGFHRRFERDWWCLLSGLTIVLTCRRAASSSSDGKLLWKTSFIIFRWNETKKNSSAVMKLNFTSPWKWHVETASSGSRFFFFFLHEPECDSPGQSVLSRQGDKCLISVWESTVTQEFVVSGGRAKCRIKIHLSN